MTDDPTYAPSAHESGGRSDLQTDGGTTRRTFLGAAAALATFPATGAATTGGGATAPDTLEVTAEWAGVSLEHYSDGGADLTVEKNDGTEEIAVDLEWSDGVYRSGLALTDEQARMMADRLERAAKAWVPGEVPPSAASEMPDLESHRATSGFTQVEDEWDGEVTVNYRTYEEDPLTAVKILFTVRNAHPDLSLDGEQAKAVAKHLRTCAGRGT